MDRCLARDNNSCQICDKKQKEGYRLHIHHIIPLREFARKVRKMDYNKANSLQNLVCLCSACHVKVESKNNYKKYKEKLQEIAIKNTENFQSRGLLLESIEKIETIKLEIKI